MTHQSQPDSKISSPRRSSRSSYPPIRFEQEPAYNTVPTKRIKHQHVVETENERQNEQESDEQSADQTNEQSDDEVDEYEAMRLANIRRNADMMLQLAIPSITLSQPSNRQKVTREPSDAKPVRLSLRSRGFNPDKSVTVFTDHQMVLFNEAVRIVKEAREQGPIDMKNAVVHLKSYHNANHFLIQHDLKGEHDSAEQENDGCTISHDSVVSVVNVSPEFEGNQNHYNQILDKLCSTFSAINEPIINQANQSINQQAEQSPATGDRLYHSNSIEPLTENRIKSMQMIGVTNKVIKEDPTMMMFHPKSTLDRSVLFAADMHGLLNISVLDHTRKSTDSEDHNFGLSFQAHSDSINDILCHSLSDRVLTASSDSLIRHADLEHQSIVPAFLHPESKGIYGLSSPSNSPDTVYASDSEGTLFEMDLRSNPFTENSQVRLHQDQVGHIDIHPHCPHLLASSSHDCTVAIWDLRAMRDEQPLHTLIHGRSVSSAIWSPSGSYLLTTSRDNKLRLFRTDSQVISDWPEPLQTNHSNRFKRHYSSIPCCIKARWTMSDDAFVIGNVDRRIDVFHLTTMPSNLLPLHGCVALRGMSYCYPVVAIHPSNRIIAACNGSGYACMLKTTQ